MSKPTFDLATSGHIRPVETLDCAGLLCPLPVYKAAIVLNRLSQGEVLELITTDPGALEDIPAMAKQRGDKLIEATQEPGRQIFLIEKGATE